MISSYSMEEDTQWLTLHWALIDVGQTYIASSLILKPYQVIRGKGLSTAWVRESSHHRLDVCADIDHGS